jgi:hypothetical protein
VQIGTPALPTVERECESSGEFQPGRRNTIQITFIKASRRRDMKAGFGLFAALGICSGLAVTAANATMWQVGAGTSHAGIVKRVPYRVATDGEATVHLVQRRRESRPKEEPPDAGPRTVSSSASPCANAYHAGMNDILRSFEPDLNAALQQARTVDTALSGRWLFHNPALKLRTVRVCVDHAEGGRCRRWENRPAASMPGSLNAAAPNAAEIKLLRAVEDFVRLRGLSSDLAKDGRFNSIMIRVSDDLSSYLSQSLNPAMCSGGEQFVDFMIANTRTFRGRLQEVANTDKALRELARKRVAHTVAVAKRAAETPTAAPASDSPAASSDASGSSTTDPSTTPSNDPGKSSEATAPPTPAAAPAPAPPPPLKPDVAAVPSDYAGMAAELVKTLPESAASIVTDGGTPLEWLTKLHGWLREGGSGLDAEQRGSLLLALRSIEAGSYAELMQSHYGAVNDALFGSIEKLRDLHKAQCTCDNR